MNSKTKKITLGIIIVCAALAFTYTAVNKKPEGTNTQNATSQSDADKKEFKIVAFGDSLTAGLDVNLVDSYPSQLQTILNNSPEYETSNLVFTVVNMGVSGESSSGGLSRVDFVLEQKPDLILMGLGANDMLRGTDPAFTLSTIDSIVQRIISSQTPLILLGMQSVASNGPEYKKDFDSIYPSLAKKYNLPLVSFFLAGVVQEPSLNNADGIHPNKAGYEKIVNENILPVLNPVLRNLLNL
jgi:acyl-CoA thioesterase-1